METPDEKWFRERLRHFLEIRHPPRQFHHVMIERRSRLAFESYAQSVVPGYRSPARKEKPPVPYSEQPRYPKRNKRK